MRILLLALFVLLPALGQAQILPARLYAVGDLDSKSPDTEEVCRMLVRLLEENPQARVLLLGDISNDNDGSAGTPEAYERLERTSCGSILRVAYSLPGNHDYDGVRAVGGVPFFFNYTFNHGVRGKGWQVFDWGGWSVMLLNSEVMSTTGGKLNNPLAKLQLDWMEWELRERYKRQCVLTAYHRPMFSSGRFASPSWVGPLFRKSIKYGVDFYLVGHEHMFAKLPSLFPIDGRSPRVDSVYGIEGIIAGAGGAVPHYPEQGKRKWAREGEEVVTNTPGVVQIDLWPGKLQWEFLPVPSRRAQRKEWPSGITVCHDNPGGYIEPQVE
ncbi:MAG: metallophosphoesterase [Candidatus Zambryskibacteria bacterium]|nr:metallophosphoesterase [Candidatus Zambryskibacteria bacterium]